MFKNSFALLLAAFLYCSFCNAQVTLPAAPDIQTAFAKGTRSKTGEPGKKYWQNTADYSLKIKFEPQTRLLSGTVAIDYINNSPDTLKQIVFKLYPNLYKKGSPHNMPVAPADMNDGVNIQSLKINHATADGKQWNIQGTNMIVHVKPLAPKQHITFDITYAYTLNKGSHIRTGQVDSGSYFIAYFFPRIAVYDDVDGWNMEPYLGTQEFYNDFCHFNAEITVPGDYQVWATGNQTNIDKVYNSTVAGRILQAEKSDAVVDVITPADQQAGNITQNKTANTWKFSADSVTDFTFALSNHYLWKSSSLVVDPKTGRRTRVDAAFNPQHQSYYKVIDYAQKTVQTMSYTFLQWPYPYPHETVFDGLDQMEYPMMVNDNPVEAGDDDIELTDHEIFHTMFPFYMGINETKYAWMDEGWATIAEWQISPMINPAINDLYGMDSYENNAGHMGDAPIMTPSTQLAGPAYLTDSYSKPAMGYLYLRDMLGNEEFLKAMHYYIEQWHGKHPMPFDFFNCINTATGNNLNWFWKNWFFDRGVPDQAITDVKIENGTGTVTVTNKGSKYMPIDVVVRYGDGSSINLHESVECWKDGNKTVTLTFKPTKIVSELVLGDGHTPDVDKNNNVWSMNPTN